MYAVDIVTIANTHIKIVSLNLFRAQITANPLIPMAVFKNETNKEIATLIGCMYGLHILHHDAHELYQSGYFPPNGVRFSELILQAIKQINLKVRPYVLTLVESFGVNDQILCSAIGNSKGDIYETHLEWAKNSRMNKTKDVIPEGFMQYMMPILKAKM